MKSFRILPFLLVGVAPGLLPAGVSAQATIPDYHYVQSSPEDQLQPKHSMMQYAKPGDVLDVEVPVLFHVASRKRLEVDTTLFPNAYDVSRPNWKKDSTAVTLEYNQRGHQVFRVIEIDGTTAQTRAIISEEPKTFFTYSSKKFRQDIEVHYYRINLDGTGLTTLTPTEGNHSASFSPDRSVLVDTYSRVDMAPVTELRSAKDGALLATLEGHRRRDEEEHHDGRGPLT